MKKFLCFLLLALPCLSGAAQTLTVSNSWSISTTEGRSYVTTGAFERGIAYNPSANHVYLMSRSGGLTVAVLNGDTGAEISFLDTTGIGGGTFALSQVAVADDGIIYGANLTVGSGGTTTNGTTGEITLTSPFRLYRWTAESAVPELVYVGNPGGTNSSGAQISARWGDDLDIRGSGTNTQVLIGSAATSLTQAAILTPSDDTLTNFVAQTINVPNAGVAIQKGITFYTNNTFFARTTGATVTRLIEYNFATNTGTVIGSININSSVAGIDYDPTNKVLVGVQTGNATVPHALLIYDLSVFSSPALVGTINFPAPVTANGNAVGGVDLGNNRVYAVDTGNGVVAAQIGFSQIAVAPTFTVQPANQTAVEGGYVTFSADAIGTRPLNFQWFFNETNLVTNATNNALKVSNLSTTNAGNYRVVVTNAGGATTSTNALLTITPSVRSQVATIVWQLAPGDRTWLTTDNSQRGLSFNPATSNLVVVSRSGGNHVYVLDSKTGTQLRELSIDPSIVNGGGTFVLNMVGVADDGAIYAGSLTTGSDGGHYKLYRWGDDTTNAAPMLVIDANPTDGLRWGDSLAIRGDGTNTQVLVGARDGGTVALLTTADGTNFTPTIITAGDIFSDRIGLAFGEGNTYWSKQNFDGPLVKVAFDPAAGAGTVVNTYANLSNATPIGYLPSGKILAAIGMETPDNLRIYNVADTNAPTLMDQDFFPTDNANGNRTGSIDFGNGMIFALDTNNGILAATLTLPVPTFHLEFSRSGNQLTLTWTAGTLQSSSDVASGYQDVPGAASGHTVNMSSAAQQYYRLRQ